MTWKAKYLVIAVLLIGFQGILVPEPAPAASPAQEVGKAAARHAIKRASGSYQKLGEIHRYKEPTKLERVTKSVENDKKKGLPRHSFWYRPHGGRKATTEHARQKLAISHPVKGTESTIVKKGTKYHERPIRNGAPHKREIILEEPVPGKTIQRGARLP